MTICASCDSQINLTEKDMAILQDSRAHGGKFKIICSDDGQMRAQRVFREHFLRFHTSPHSGSVILIEPTYEEQL